MHDQKTPGPGAPAVFLTATGRTAAIREIVAAYTRPKVSVPMDGAAGAAPAAAAPAAAGEGGGAPAPADGGGGEPSGIGGTPVVPAGPAGSEGTPAPPAPTPPPAPPKPTPPPAPVKPATGKPAGDDGSMSLDDLDLPPKTIAALKELRKENQELRNRTKAAETDRDKTVEQWGERVLRAFGFIEDPAAELTPEQRASQLTEQLDSVSTSWRDSQIELAIWKGAHTHGADPSRLTDSRTFMKAVGGLDPTADDFTTKVSEAIGTAVAGNEHYKAQSAPGGLEPPVVPPLPPVPSGGEFGAGSGEPSSEPQTVDEFRAALRDRERVR